MKIVMYTTHCPRCKVLEMKLKAKHVEYIECTDIEVMTKLGIYSVPCLGVDDKILNFTDAVEWVKGQ